jgi:hypothetical protein
MLTDASTKKTRDISPHVSAASVKMETPRQLQCCSGAIAVSTAHANELVLHATVPSQFRAAIVPEPMSTGPILLLMLWIAFLA